jgi:hypothetical protein
MTNPFPTKGTSRVDPLRIQSSLKIVMGFLRIRLKVVKEGVGCYETKETVPLSLCEVRKCPIKIQASLWDVAQEINNVFVRQSDGVGIVGRVPFEVIHPTIYNPPILHE